MALTIEILEIIQKNVEDNEKTIRQLEEKLANHIDSQEKDITNMMAQLQALKEDLSELCKKANT